MKSNLNLSLTHQSNGGMQVCDNCHTFKRRCDRKLPKCSLCVAKGLECKRERKLQRKHFMQQDDKFYSCIFNSLILTRHSKKKERAKKEMEGKIIKENLSQLISKEVKVEVEEEMFKENLSQLISKEINSSVLRAPIFKLKMPKFDIASMTVSRFPIYSFLVILKSQEKLSRMYEIDPIAGIFFFLRSMNLPTSNSLEVSIPSMNRFILNHSITRKATFAYFKYVNIVFPLFSMDDFCNKPRSILVKAAVILVGLTLIEENEEVKALGKQLKEVLIGIITKLIKNPNLIWVQTLLILANGLRGHPYSPPNHLLFDIIKICHAIGLHVQPSRKLPFHIQLEKQLAYSAALYFDTNSNPRSSGCFNHSNIWTKSLNYKHDVYKKLEYELLMIMGEFRYNLAKNLYIIFQLFKQIEEKKHFSQNFCKEIQVYFDVLKEYTFKAFYRLHKLKKSHVYVKFTPLIDVILNSVGLLSNSVYVSLYELKRSVSKVDDLQDIRACIKCIARLFQYNQRLGPFPYSNNRIFSVYNCIRFLACHYQFLKECDKLIYEGLELFYFLRTIPLFKTSVETSLALIDITLKAIGIPVLVLT